ncbi:putative tyrosine transporter P-protein [Hydrogenivirga caldilitoris]|uniref:Putative tyrosine transporter P-protein n=1 Tax=Hydrogenivirga caldilitoris TaxID=246264 RepID=A0A497XPF7_9AQUI|nr:ArsB/NhaD family transporter [Hydrogenivirga caldilitoris]RLJ70866.1 putative tyrosine transporter P-protein [Hydrogenivirga caldilitoris]
MIEAHEIGGLLQALHIHISQTGLQKLALGIFILVYVMIVLEKYFHRTVAALLGASVIMVLGVISPHDAWSSIDYNTIFLLFGMMNIVTVLAHSGFFNLLAIKALKVTGTNPFKILLTFTILTAVFSAFLDNVTTVLFMTPIIIRIAKVLDLPPVPYVIALVLASNTGGTTTLIGDPPNIIIGSIAKKSFNDFLIHVAPHAIIGFVVGLVVNLLYLQFKGLMKPRKEDIDLKEFEELQSEEVYPDLMRKGVITFVGTIVLFILGHTLHIEPGIIALFTSTLLMMWSGLSPAYVLEKVEWTTLLFFVGLFIVVGSLEHTGVFTEAANYLMGLMGTDVSKGIWIIGASSAVISGFVDNIPFTMSMSFVLKNMAQHITGDFDALWWSLSLGACLGGNFTIIGASANIVAAAIAEKEGYHISFLTFMKYGTPVAILSTAVALLSLYILRF